MLKCEELTPLRAAFISACDGTTIMNDRRLMKIVSGGQTGVDQAALRAGEAFGLELGGWCPPGRIGESGQIPERFPVRDTPQERSSHAPEIPRSLRTEWNVRDSDATLVLRLLVPIQQPRHDPGTRWTFECTVIYGKPLLVCDPNDPDGAGARMVHHWLETLGVRILNVAGPAESTQPGIGRLAEKFLIEVFRQQTV